MLKSQEDVHHIRLVELVDWWVVRGENEEGGASPLHKQIEFRKDEETEARQCATEWAKVQGFPSYFVSKFTGRAYVFLVATVNVVTGETIEEHEENYGA